MKRLWFVCTIVSFVLFFTSCALGPGPDRIAAATSAFQSQQPNPYWPDMYGVSDLGDLPWKGKHKDADKWAQHLIKIVKDSKIEEITIKDPSAFCPKYNSLPLAQREYFWVHLIAKMTQFESGFDPAKSYKENFRDPDGTFVISRGLLQISRVSSLGYGCKTTQASLLYDPYFNLSCGLKIFERWVPEHKAIALGEGDHSKGGAKYWSVLRTSSSAHKKISGYTKALKFCH